jgi:hypothetical protein
MSEQNAIETTTGTSTMAVCPICGTWLNYVGQLHSCYSSHHPQTYQPDYVSVLNRIADALEGIKESLCRK